jgi:hypothetical protein
VGAVKRRSPDVARVCRLLRMRLSRWPLDWPTPTGPQYVMLRALLRARPNAFVAAVDIHTGLYRVIVLDGRGTWNGTRAREYVLLLDGRMRRVQPGVPYTEDETRQVAA